MADLVPVPPAPVRLPAPTLLSPLTDPAGGGVLARLHAFGGQAPVRRMIPWFLGVGAIGAAALTWMTLAPGPQRTLYDHLDDGERASVVEALGKADIAYRIDNESGALTVGESDYYKARMLVASDNALASPQTQSGADLLDSLPIGASRTLEGERLREAREHDLMLTIAQIDGVEAVRVHLAEAEHSVFVRDDTPPTASVMIKLAHGRHLSDGQVAAIVNLVAGSVSGLSPDAVRVVDQSGELLSDPNHADADRLELQARMEEKLRTQVATLLTPMIGADSFSSEIQVDLDMDQVTTARESYDKNGAVRSETAQASQSSSPAPAAGVPGVLSNTPPPPTTVQNAPPTGTPSAAASSGPTNSDSTTSKTYELGREVSVADAQPGKIKRLSVAVAISATALKGAKAADLAQIKQLVSAAVGADTARGDQIEVQLRSFDAAPVDKLPFYEAPWFATVVRSAVALIAVLLVLLLGVRPLIKALRPGKAGDADPASPDTAADLQSRSDARMIAAPLIADDSGIVNTELLTRKVGIAQRLAAEKPDSAVAALRTMLAEPETAEMAA